VLLVSDFFPPVRGGLEVHVDELAAELSARGHDVHVATLTPDATPTADSVQVHVVTTLSSAVVRHEHADRPFHPPVPDPRAHTALATLVTKLRPDVVHAHSWLGVSLPRRHRPPVVFTAHDYALICQLHTLLRTTGLRTTGLRTTGERCGGPSARACVPCGARRHGVVRSVALATSTPVGRRLLPADRVLTLSAHVAATIRPYLRVPVETVGGFVRAVRTAAPNGNVELPALPAGPFVLYAGDPGPHKGLDLLLDLWAGSAVPAPLVVATTKPLVRNVSGDVTVVTLSRDQMAVAQRRAAVAVVPSQWDEPYGMVAAEALTAGVPVVASRVGALPELVTDGVDGVLVPAGDRDALGAALTGLVTDEPRRAAFAAAAVRGAVRFGPDAVLPRIEAAYRAAMQRAA
jgi:glycosyltransferase involved in cell wall biosynthesis